MRDVLIVKTIDNLCKEKTLSIQNKIQIICIKNILIRTTEKKLLKLKQLASLKSLKQAEAYLNKYINKIDKEVEIC